MTESERKCAAVYVVPGIPETAELNIRCVEPAGHAYDHCDASRTVYWVVMK